MNAAPDAQLALALGHRLAGLAADKAGDDWKDEAFAAFCRHAAMGEPFTTEDVRLANPSLPPPPDRRAWGQVALRAQREEVVVAIGQRRVKSSHGMFKTLWSRA